jgi:hypothetical protein
VESAATFMSLNLRKRDYLIAPIAVPIMEPVTFASWLSARVVRSIRERQGNGGVMRPIETVLQRKRYNSSMTAGDSVNLAGRSKIRVRHFNRTIGSTDQRGLLWQSASEHERINPLCADQSSRRGNGRHERFDLIADMQRNCASC